ncbi:MAG: hypothetical protein ACREX0_10250, partial [Noviherbaspirillum sp.]
GGNMDLRLQILPHQLECMPQPCPPLTPHQCRELERRFCGDGAKLFAHVTTLPRQSQQAMLTHSPLLRDYLGLGNQQGCEDKQRPNNGTRIPIPDAPAALAWAAALQSDEGESLEALNRLEELLEEVPLKKKRLNEAFKNNPADAQKYLESVQDAFAELAKNYDKLPGECAKKKVQEMIAKHLPKLDELLPGSWQKTWLAAQASRTLCIPPVPQKEDPCGVCKPKPRPAPGCGTDIEAAERKKLQKQLNNLRECLPPYIFKALKDALKQTLAAMKSDDPCKQRDAIEKFNRTYGGYFGKLDAKPATIKKFETISAMIERELRSADDARKLLDTLKRQGLPREQLAWIKDAIDLALTADPEARDAAIAKFNKRYGHHCGKLDNSVSSRELFKHIADLLRNETSGCATPQDMVNTLKQSGVSYKRLDAFKDAINHVLKVAEGGDQQKLKEAIAAFNKEYGKYCGKLDSKPATLHRFGQIADVIEQELDSLEQLVCILRNALRDAGLLRCKDAIRHVVTCAGDRNSQAMDDAMTAFNGAYSRYAGCMNPEPASLCRFTHLADIIERDAASRLMAVADAWQRGQLA